MNKQQQERHFQTYKNIIADIGYEYHEKVENLNILVIGCDGVGVEIIRNLSQLGVKKIDAMDKDTYQDRHLKTIYFLKEYNLASTKTKAELTSKYLSSLSEYTTVTAVSHNLKDLPISHYDIIIDTMLSLKDSVFLNEKCRKNKVGFIKSQVFGVTAFSFTDFGKDFVCSEHSSEVFSPKYIEDIFKNPKNEKEIIIQCYSDDAKLLDLFSVIDHTNFITIQEVKGSLGDLLNNKIFQVKEDRRQGKISSVSVIIKVGKVGEFSYEGGGRVFQQKKPTLVEFESLKKSIKTPVKTDELLGGVDYLMINQLHLGVRTLLSLSQEELSVAPKTVEELLKKAKKINKDSKTKGFHFVEEIDETKLKLMFSYADKDFPLLNTFFGGLVAQQVIKFTGKYLPDQWTHFQCFNVLSSEESFLDEDTLEKLRNYSLLIVGSGALGKESLRNLALLGVSVGEKGNLFLIDKDTKKAKETSKICKEQNDICTVVVLDGELTSEALAEKDIWSEVEVVFDCSRNEKVHKFLDEEALFYEKSLLVSDVEGSRFTTRVVIPRKTLTFQEGLISESSKDKTIPCPYLTLHFPTKSTHCLPLGTAWTNRISLLENSLQTQEEVIKFFENPESFLERMEVTFSEEEERLSEKYYPSFDLKAIVEFLERAFEKEMTYERCVELAFIDFYRFFRDKIHQLLLKYPKEAKREDGKLFWGGERRFPDLIDFDSRNESHMSFVLERANLIAFSFGIFKTKNEFCVDKKLVRKVVSELVAPSLPEVEVEEEEDPVELLKALKHLSKDKRMKNLPLVSVEELKDTEHYYSLVLLSVNLLCSNYDLEAVERVDYLKESGLIKTQMPTAVSCAVALCCIELIVLLKNDSLLNREANISLESNLIVFSELTLASKAIKEFDNILMTDTIPLVKDQTKWDKYFITGSEDTTVGDFLEALKAKVLADFSVSITISMLFIMELVVYSDFMNTKKLKKRMKEKLIDVVREKCKKRMRKDCIEFEVSIEYEDFDSDDVPIIPPIVFKY